ncbi:MAG: DUF1800 family protein, partial [Chitinophagales bacterium]|nr:DUF1800 family protein [Chitinophagales bacterium]
MLPSPTYNLKPIERKIEKQELIHLLRRSLFGVGHKELSYFKEKTIQEILHILLKPSLPADIPLQDDPDIIDPIVPKGKTWINAPYENDDIDKYRRIALRAWWTGNIITRDFSLTEKMTLFWHNHFVTEMDVVKDSRYSYSYVALLRKHALG